MARLPRLCLPNIPQHIIQRGSNRQACFASNEDMAAYADWLNEYANEYGVGPLKGSPISRLRSIGRAWL